jgi:hypothetical protein
MAPIRLPGRSSNCAPLAIALVFAAVSATAQTVDVQRIDVVKHGIYSVEIDRTVDNQDLPGGRNTYVSNIQNTKVTSDIPARIGMTFGFEYVVRGTPDDAELTLQKVIRVPPQGLRDPITRSTFYRSEDGAAVRIGRQSYAGYTLEYDWELVPGLWTFELWYQGRKLAEQVFMIGKMD